MSWTNSLQSITESANKVAGTISAIKNPIPAAPTSAAAPAAPTAAPMDWKKYLLPGGIVVAVIVAAFFLLRQK